MQENTTQTTEVSEQKLSTDQQLVIDKPALWQRIAFWTIFPAILIVPVWVAVGRGFLGAGGWLMFMTMAAAAFVVLPYHIVLTVLALVNKKSYLSKISSRLLFIYYALLLVSQVSLVDGGDTQDSIGSVLTFIGVPGSLNAMIYLISALACVAVMIALVVELVKDIKRTRSERQAGVKA